MLRDEELHQVRAIQFETSRKLTRAELERDKAREQCENMRKRYLAEQRAKMIVQEALVADVERYLEELETTRESLEMAEAEVTRLEKELGARVSASESAAELEDAKQALQFERDRVDAQQRTLDRLQAEHEGTTLWGQQLHKTVEEQGTKIDLLTKMNAAQAKRIKELESDDPTPDVEPLQERIAILEVQLREVTVERDEANARVKAMERMADTLADNAIAWKEERERAKSE